MHPLWLLLISATVGTMPSQARSGEFATYWMQHFFGTCIPTHMIGGVDLVSFIPHPNVTDGFIHTERLQSDRHIIRRPDVSDNSIVVGTQCNDVGSGMVESYGAADPIYAKARFLQLSRKPAP